jgi:hypothetical protein
MVTGLRLRNQGIWKEGLQILEREHWDSRDSSRYPVSLLSRGIFGVGMFLHRTESEAYQTLNL